MPSVPGSLRADPPNSLDPMAALILARPKKFDLLENGLLPPKYRAAVSKRTSRPDCRATSEATLAKYRSIRVLRRRRASPHAPCYRQLAPALGQAAPLPLGRIWFACVPRKRLRNSETGVKGWHYNLHPLQTPLFSRYRYL